MTYSCKCVYMYMYMMNIIPTAQLTTKHWQ